MRLRLARRSSRASIPFGFHDTDLSASGNVACGVKGDARPSYPSGLAVGDGVERDVSQSVAHDGGGQVCAEILGVARTGVVGMATIDAADDGFESEAPLATGEQLEHFYAHLQEVLTAGGFLDPDNPRHLMRRLRRLIVRAQPDQNEINILRGMLSALDPKARSRAAGR